VSRLRVPRSLAARLALTVLLLGGVFALFWWRGPSFSAIGSAFTSVVWEWVVVAIALNLLSVVVRALAWTTVIRSAIDPPYPKPLTVFSAFSVGLFANAVLPGRIGELARVAVLVRKLPRRKGLWATLVGTVLAHRVFDIVPVLLLVLYVLLTAKVPAWAITILVGIVGVGVALFTFAIVSARTDHGSRLDGVGALRRVVAGWICQLLAVWTAMRAFGIHAPLPAAGVVLLVINVVTIFPFWPGNVGAVQLAIAAPLSASYGVAYATGVAYGFGLQAIEASVGIGVGLIFLAREGLSVAMLRVMPSAAQTEVPEPHDERDDDAEPARARVSG
jgi:uncharacterized membrane protein YbhN (UPF0104 family)